MATSKLVAPCTTTRHMAISMVSVAINIAKVVLARRTASLAALVAVGVDQPHDHARVAFDLAAIDIMRFERDTNFSHIN